MSIQTGLSIKSVAFSEGGNIPSRYCCEGEEMNPPLEITSVPPETRSLAIILEDHEAPEGIFDHGLMWDIPPHASIVENAVPGTKGRNSFGKIGYSSPCPSKGVHWYFFTVFALDCFLNVPEGSGKAVLLEAVWGHVLATAHLKVHHKKNDVSH